MVSNALKPIPEHKFGTLYFYLFNEAFTPSLFGHHYSNIAELIASKPNLCRRVTDDGTAYIPTSEDGKYRVPKWSMNASNKRKLLKQTSISLKVYKENKFIKSLSLSDKMKEEVHKFHFVFGRDLSADFYVCHPSISRKHAVFQFANDSALFVFDVSIHGTRLNKKAIPTKKYVELKHGDVIKFGHSTRSYVLCINVIGDDAEAAEQNNNKENSQIDEMQKEIEKLKKELDGKSKQVNDLMQQMESLKVGDAQKRISSINGIDFVKEANNLSKLTVVKLRYYTDANKIDVGKVKKAELVKIVKKDLKKHFDI